MPKIFIPSAKSIENLIRVLLNTSLFAIIFAYILLFLFIAIVNVVLYENFFSDEMKDLRYSRALDQVSLILGLIYSIWITNYLKGYSSMASRYNDLIMSVQNYSLNFFNTIAEYDFDACTTTTTQLEEQRIGGIRKQQQQQTTTTTKEAEVKIIIDVIEQVRDTCMLIISHGYKLFSCEEPDNLYGTHKYINDNIIHDKNISNGQNSSITHHILMSRLYSNLQCQNAILEKKKCFFSVPNMNSLEEDIRAIRKIFNDIEAASKVSEPSIFTTTIFISLMIYLMIWVPYVLWASFGIAPTLFIYPVIMLLLTILVIIRDWLGNAFDKKRPINYMNFYEWRLNAYKTIMIYSMTPINKFENAFNIPITTDPSSILQTSQQVSLSDDLVKKLLLLYNKRMRDIYITTLSSYLASSSQTSASKKRHSSFGGYNNTMSSLDEEKPLYLYNEIYENKKGNDIGGGAASNIRGKKLLKYGGGGGRPTISQQQQEDDSFGSYTSEDQQQQQLNSTLLQINQYNINNNNNNNNNN